MSEKIHRTGTVLVLDSSDHSPPSDPDDVSAEDALKGKQHIFLNLISQHGGVCFSAAGHNAVAEFPSAVEAVRCAVDIQQAMLGENKRLPLDQRELLRIGLHIGDLVEENGYLFGDAVDTAGGLEELAVPGGICLSGAIYEQVKHRARVAIEFSGEQKINNVFEPVGVYQVIEPGVEKGYFSIWAELKRRNVFRVSAGYIVVAWLLIQVADVILPTFNSPPVVMQILIAGLILGFPVAAVLAWVYELTPVGLQRSDDVLRQSSMRWLTGRRLDGAIISLLVVAVVFLVYENYVAKGIANLAKSKPVSIAVMAFRNQSASTDDEYFAEGLADELLSELSRIRELKVASRSASFYFKNKDADLDSVASSLMVDNIISGSVRRDGDRLRVTAALDNTENDNLLWSETYDGKLSSILDVQSDIARSVVDAIVPVLSPESQSRISSRPTDNPEAYQFYLRGRDYLRQPAETSTLNSAKSLFERAITLDRRFAQAHAGLCEAYLSEYDFTREMASFEKAETTCQRALTLDDGLWEVHLALGNLYSTSAQFDAATEELTIAIKQQPNSAVPYLALAETYAGQNKFDDAEATFRRAREVEGGYWDVYRKFGNFLYDRSRYPEAIENYRKLIELTPDSGIGYDNLGNTYLALGELEKAEEVFNASPLPSRWTYSNRGLVHYYQGEFIKSSQDFEKALEVAPNVHWNWGFLGDAYRFVPNKEKQAAEAYTKAIELAKQDLQINSQDWGAVGRLTTYYANTGELAAARERLADLLNLTDDPTALYYAAIVSIKLGDLDSANNYLQKAIDGGWSQRLLAGDPDLVALQGMPAYDALQQKPQG
ncbi:MAG: tetratricopeptide repeat protein [Gammaproteobacteria bacterium]|nr:tetratricopeptide repeat protein [Gammaproteobacteria bacterium]